MVAAGVGYGTLNPASTTAAMSWFPPRRRATVVGLKQVGLPFGGMLGAAIVPMLALRLGWRRAVVVAALLIVVCAAACALIYRDPPGDALARPAPGERAGTARGRLRLLGDRLERRPAHADGWAGGPRRRHHRRGPRPCGLLARRHARPTGLRRVRRVGGRLPRAVARLGAHDGGRAPGPGARPRAPAPRVAAFLTRARSFLTPAPSPRPAGATPPS